MYTAFTSPKVTSASLGISHMPKKVTPTQTVEEPVESGNGFFDYLKSGESYTSLVLGIIVVIISTALLLSFFHNRNSAPTQQSSSQEVHSIAQISQKALPLTVTPKVNGTVDSEAAVTGPAATKAPTATPTTKPTAKPTEAKKAQPAKEAAPAAGVYTVKAGDTLWSIAERHYKSGYNWVDIARANNLSKPGEIETNQKLKLPKVTAKTQTTEAPKKEVVQKEQKNTTIQGEKITGNSYTVKKSDSLWKISIRAYGNGYKWPEIAKANKLANPHLIHPGNKLKIPRGK